MKYELDSEEFLTAIRESFVYDEGKLLWRIARSNGIKPGDFAGCLHKPSGYFVVRFNAKLYKHHRLIWRLHGNTLAGGVIDHINQIKTDNRIENLRKVTQHTNSQNRHDAEREDVGVILDKRNGNWLARLTHNYKHIHIGSYKTKEEAIAARKEAVKLYRGEINA